MQKKRRADAAPQDAGDSRELLRSIIHFMRQNQQLSLPEIINIYTDEGPDESIPLSIFSTNLSPSESLCRFLKENRSLSFHEIAVLLNRDDRSVWTSYERAKRKSKAQFTKKSGDIFIPVSIFNDRSLSILEHAVNHLKTAHSLNNSKIAALLSKNPASIATVANRAEDKRRKQTRQKNNG